MRRFLNRKRSWLMFPGQSSKSQRGLSLLEIIIVVALIGTIMGIVINTIMGASENANIDLTIVKMQRLGQNLQTYRVHNHRYPTTDQGLEALLTAPGDARRWRGPYAQEDQLEDVWGARFEYESDGQTYRLTSPGPSGALGTQDDITFPENRE